MFQSLGCWPNGKQREHLESPDTHGVILVQFLLLSTLQHQISQHGSRRLIKGLPLMVSADHLLSDDPGQRDTSVIPMGDPMFSIDDE